MNARILKRKNHPFHSLADLLIILLMDIEANPESKIIGFREWISLPGIGLRAIKAKVDTGAKTSSLHAFDIHLEKEGKKTYVVFKVHPLQNEIRIVNDCRALLVDQRTVTDSGGHKEERYVIRTTLVMGGVKKRIELTLSNRETMKYRMLIGRAALDHFYIDPSQSYLCGKTIKQRRHLKELKHQLGKGAGKIHQSSPLE
jgi:hypothetical protein